MLQMLLIGAMHISLFALDIAFGAAILYGMYQFADEPDIEFIDFKVACLFVFIPGVLIFAAASSLNLLGLNPIYSFFGLPLYVLIPFFWLKHFIDFDTKSAALFALLVPIAIFTKWLVLYGAKKALTIILG